MKITVNVECTPDEARAFFGMPDVRPMQEAVLNDVQARVMSNIQAMDPAELLKTWFPASLESFKQWQEMFAPKVKPTK